MTTVDAAAAWRVKTSITLAAIAAFLGVGLAGCETSSNLLGSSDTPTTLAEPAAGKPAAQRAKMTIAPVIGAPDAVAKQLQAQLKGAMEKHSIAISKDQTDRADYTVRGYIVSAREKTGTKLSYIWDVTDPAGKRVNRITGEEIIAGAPGKDPWAAVSPTVVQSIADKTATSIATWLPSQTQAAVASTGSAPASGAGAPMVPTQTASLATTDAAPAGSAATRVAATPPATASTEVTAVVPSVTGAPGDGSTSLTGALQRELTRSGIVLSETGGPQAYRVEGKVSMGEGKDGKQPIQIDWHVKDPQGKKLGTVSQKNEVPQGSLDGAWGKTADLAAAAAAQGIIKLLPQAKSTN